MCVVTAPLNTLHAIQFAPPLSPLRRQAVEEGQVYFLYIYAYIGINLHIHMYLDVCIHTYVCVWDMCVCVCLYKKPPGGGVSYDQYITALTSQL